MNIALFYKFKNSLITEIRLIIRNKFYIVLLLFVIFVNTLEFIYIIPADRITGNSIAVSAWVTQCYIILGISFGILCSEKETNDINELVAAISATNIKTIVKIMVVILQAIILYGLCVIFLIPSFIFKNAKLVLILAALKYIVAYWILPFIVSAFVGLIISFKIVGKIKYVLAMVFIIISGPMMPTLLAPLIDTMTEDFKYVSIFNIGPLNSSRPMHLMFGYSIPFEKVGYVILLTVSLITLYLMLGITHRIIKYLGISIAVCLIACSYYGNFDYIAKNYDYEIAMNMYKIYSQESELVANNEYQISSMYVSIDEQVNTFDFDVQFKINCDQTSSYITFMLYHEFKINNISINGKQIKFTQDKDLVAIRQLFEENQEYEISVSYTGTPAIHMYNNYKNWIMPEYFAWYPLQGSAQNIEYSNDLFEINFTSESPKEDIYYHIILNGNKVLYCNLDQLGDNEWQGYSKGLTLLDSDFMKTKSDGNATYIYPIVCQNYENYVDQYRKIFSEYANILEMNYTEDSTFLFLCDSTYIGHGEMVRTCEDEVFIEITRAYIDGSKLNNTNLGIYALVKDKYLKNANDAGFEYLFKCCYITALANQGKVNSNLMVRNLDELYEMYKEDAENDAMANLTKKIAEFIVTSTQEQQEVFFEKWSEMLNNQIYDIQQTIALLERIEDD